jgi:hypothetical protein
MPIRKEKATKLLVASVCAWMQQREQIYEAVMADSSQPPADASALKPGSFLTYEQTLDEHPLPQEVAAIDGLQGLNYVKGKDKVLLVRPPNGVVVDEITL